MASSPAPSSPDDAPAPDRRGADASTGDTAHARLDSAIDPGELSAMIAHEVNNLMTPVKAYAEAALRTGDDSAFARRALTVAASSATAATEISRAILSLSRDQHRPATGWQSSQPGATPSLRSIIEDALAAIGHAHGAQISVDVDPSVRVAAPRVVVQQVIMNVVINAQRQMTATGGGISIGLEHDIRTKNDQKVRVRVLDDGPGLPEDVLRHPDRPPGAGLGLMICSRLLARVGGAIELANNPGGGATVVIELPAAAAGAQAHPAA